LIDFPYVPAWWVSIALLLAAVGVFLTNKPLWIKIAQALTRLLAASLYFLYSVVTIEMIQRSNQSRVVWAVLFFLDFAFSVYCYFRRTRLEKEIAILVHKINTEKTI
jgi:hypothetical protein